MLRGKPIGIYFANLQYKTESFHNILQQMLAQHAGYKQAVNYLERFTNGYISEFE